MIKFGMFIFYFRMLYCAPEPYRSVDVFVHVERSIGRVCSHSSRCVCEYVRAMLSRMTVRGLHSCESRSGSDRIGLLYKNSRILFPPI